MNGQKGTQSKRMVEAQMMSRSRNDHVSARPTNSGAGNGCIDIAARVIGSLLARFLRLSWFHQNFAVETASSFAFVIVASISAGAAASVDRDSFLPRD